MSYFYEDVNIYHTKGKLKRSYLFFILMNFLISLRRLERYVIKSFKTGENGLVDKMRMINVAQKANALVSKWMVTLQAKINDNSQ